MVGLSSSYGAVSLSCTIVVHLDADTTYLQKTVYHLPAHIILVCREELAFQHAKDAFCNAVVGFQVLGCPWSTANNILRGVRYIYS